MDFKPFYSDWVDISPLTISRVEKFRLKDPLPINLSKEFFQSLEFNDSAFLKYRINAAHKAASVLGSRPALCISGGIDSQAMLHSWLEADLKFDAFILVFKNELNSQDVNHARYICKEFGVKLNEIEIDIIKFLSYYNYEYATKYSCCSPHFNTHFKLFNLIKDLNYTGVCCGGDAPQKNILTNLWGTNFTPNPNAFIKYSEVENYPCVGNFLSYDPKLAWALALILPPVFNPPKSFHEGSVTQNMSISEHGTIISLYQAKYSNSISQRYTDKCYGYKKFGFSIHPQDQKYSGFEKVKEYLEKSTGDGWEFEKRYRYPIENLIGYPNSEPYFMFNEDIEELINQIYNHNLGLI